MAAKHIKAWVVDQGCGLTCTGFQCGHGHKRFVGRTRRISAAQSAVEQGLVRRFIEHLPVVLVNALDKQIGIKSRLADKGQDLAVFRVDGHQRTTPLAKHALHQLLQLDVDSQHHGIAWRGFTAAQAPHGTPPGRGFNMFDAGDAVQLALKALFHAQFAYVFGAPVIGLVIIVFDFFFFALVDAPDVADHMAGQFTVGVITK